MSGIKQAKQQYSDEQRIIIYKVYCIGLKEIKKNNYEIYMKKC